MGKAFNYKAYKARWRERCAHFGIDPETGATSYQVALVQAEIDREAKWARMRYREDGRPWWMDSRLWVDDRPRDATEAEALMHIRRACRGEPDLRQDGPWPREDLVSRDMITLRELWREVRKELPLYERRRVPTVKELFVMA